MSETRHAQGATRRRVSARAARLAARAATALVVTLALVVGVVRGGTRYFFCAPMSLVSMVACCADDHEEDAAEHADEARATPQLSSDDEACCRAQMLRKVPLGSGAVRAEHVVAPPSSRAIEAIAPLYRVAASRAARARVSPRALPRDPPTAAEVRPQLMVFLV